MTQANDSITITPGTGATVATHMVNAKEHQVVVLADQTGALDPTRTVTGTVAVSNLPATQPVSGTVTANAGTGPWPVTDNGGSLTVDGSVSIGNFPATQPVSGTVAVNNFPATQTVAGTVTANEGTLQSATLMVTATGAAAAAVTLTLPAVAGQFHYITSVEITAYTTLARTGGVTPVIVTTTNLPGTPAFTLQSAAAVGTNDRYLRELSLPLKSSVVNTATTIVGPATTSVIWRMNVTYYTAA